MRRQTLQRSFYAATSVMIPSSFVTAESTRPISRTARARISLGQESSWISNRLELFFTTGSLRRHVVAPTEHRQASRSRRQAGALRKTVRSRRLAVV